MPQDVHSGNCLHATLLRILFYFCLNFGQRQKQNSLAMYLAVVWTSFRQTHDTFVLFLFILFIIIGPSRFLLITIVVFVVTFIVVTIMTIIIFKIITTFIAIIILVISSNECNAKSIGTEEELEVNMAEICSGIYISDIHRHGTR